MSADLRTLLRESAPVPREPADVDALFERVDRRRAGRLVARVAGLAVALAAAVVVVQLIGAEPVTPVIDQDSSLRCSELADNEQLLDEAQVDLDEDGRTDRVLLVRKRFGDHLVLCLAEGTRRRQDLPDLQARADRVEAVDLAGTPGVALIHAPDPSRPEYQQYYLAVLRSDGADSSWLYTFQIVWDVPDEERLGNGAGGGGYPLVDHRGSGTSVETFGCRPTDEGAGVEIIELRIEQFDDEIAVGGDAFEYVGDDLAVSYVVRQVEPDWGGMTPPSERTAVPIEGDTVRPAELLAGLDATWLCRPAPLIVHELAVAGAFDRARGEELRLDPDTDVRLHGQFLAEVDGATGSTIAVAADGAIGVREDGSMRIIVDGTQLAHRALSPQPETWWELDSVAFDSDGTLWGLDGRTVVGLRRDGTTVDVQDAFAPVDGPGAFVGLRVTGTVVSVVLYDFDDPDFAVVVPAVGEDPLDGSRSVDSPIPPAGMALPPGVPYIDGSRTILTSRLLLASSIAGTAWTELDWQAPPSDEAGYGGAVAESQIVADTAASLVHLSIYDGYFLIVHRADGLAAAALVGGGPHAGVSVSPDGAVHLLTRTDNETMTIRTLLDGDLRPLQGPPIVSDTTTESPRPPLECREPAEGEQVVDDVDLDGDGTDDQVTLHRDGVLLACLADGSVTAVGAYPTPPGFEDNGTSQSIAAADLGGSDGIIVTLAPGPDVPFHTQNYLLRVDRGRLGIVGDSSVTAFGLPDVQGLTHYGDGWDFPTGDHAAGTAGSLGLLGCRPSERPAADFDAVTLIHSEDGRLRAEMVSVTGIEVIYANSPSESIPGLPDTAAREELDQILLDMGFTPGCRPAP